MTRSVSSEDLVFDYRTLRLIIGALAFAFPSTVIVLTGKITTSISASYYEEGNRDVFVGFLFILGALLIAYKGHLHGDPKPPNETVWAWIFSFKWIRVYQEYIGSTLGGFAAIFTALYPTNCDGCPINTRASIHMIGAGILFSTVVYFSLFAFLRSVNQKLEEDNPDFAILVQRIRDHWYSSVPIFLNIAGKISKDYDQNNEEQIASALLNRSDEANGQAQFAEILSRVKARKPNKLAFVWLAYEKKISRGVVYLVCGSLITITLAVFLYLVVTRPDRVAHSITTFVAETISLVFFGIAWMTASKLEYLKQILDWLYGGASTETPTPVGPKAVQKDAE